MKLMTQFLKYLTQLNVGGKIINLGSGEPISVKKSNKKNSQ